MTSTLSTRQRLLTKATNKLASLLDTVIREGQQDQMELPRDIEERRMHIQSRQLRLRKARKVIEVDEKNVQGALQAYNEEADSLPADTPQLSDILEKVKTNSVNAENVLERAMFSWTEIE